MKRMRDLLLFPLVGYATIVGTLYAFQRKLQYHPLTQRVAPEQFGLLNVHETKLSAADGTKLITWYSPAPKDRPTILFFHGNAGAIWSRTDRFKAYQKAGYGVFFPSYRGYGGSEGNPSEKGLVDDGILAFDWLLKKGVNAEKIVIIGESLGSGVAVQVAEARTPAALILEAPFSSAVDVGAHYYPWLPVRTTMEDQFHSDQHIQHINTPLTIFHGDQDHVVPLEFGKKLFDHAVKPKEMIVIKGAGHSDIAEEGIWDREFKVIEKLGKTPKPE